MSAARSGAGEPTISVAPHWRADLADQVSPLLETALAEGMGSAIALGVVLLDGDRATSVHGETKRVRQAPTGWVPAAGRRVTAETPFDVASLTKPMVTSTLLAGAVATERVGLNQRLDAVLPRALGTPLGARSLADLLGHRSGAIAWHDFYSDVRALSPERRPDAILDAVLRRGLRAAIPSVGPAPALYSDLGFIALGSALEAIYGAPLDALFASHVAAPLGIRARFRRISAADASAADASGAAAGAPRPAGLDEPAESTVATEIWSPRCRHGEALQGEVHDDNCAGLDGVAGHAGLFASLNDVLTWAHAWLSAYSDRPTGLGRRLPMALVRAWVAPTMAPPSTWRYGFDTPSPGSSSAGGRVSATAFGHLGFTGTGVWIDPTRGAAVVLLTNRVHPSRDDHASIKALRPVVHDAVWQVLDA